MENHKHKHHKKIFGADAVVTPIYGGGTIAQAPMFNPPITNIGGYPIPSQLIGIAPMSQQPNYFNPYYSNPLPVVNEDAAGFLNYGDRNANVTQLQRVLGVTQSGIFDAATLQAVRELGMDSPLSADDYNNIMETLG